MLQSESGVNDENTQHWVVSAAGIIDSRRDTRDDVGIGGGKTTESGDCEDQPKKFVTVEWELNAGHALGAAVLERC